PSRVEYAQDKLLHGLEASTIVLDAVRKLWQARRNAKALVPNQKRVEPSARFVWQSEEEKLDRRGIDSKSPASQEMLRLRESLKPFLELQNKEKKLEDLGRDWPVIQECEKAIKNHRSSDPGIAQELWGHLIGACEKIAGYVTSWSKTDERWK